MDACETVKVVDRKAAVKANYIRSFMAALHSYMKTDRLSIDVAYQMLCDTGTTISKSYFKKICNDTWQMEVDNEGRAWVVICR